MQTDKPGSLNDKFEHFGAAPSDQLWNAIESSLDQDTRKKRGAFWWWFGGIAAGTLLIISVYRMGYYVGKTENAADVSDNTLLHASELSATDQQLSPEDQALNANATSAVAKQEAESAIDQNGVEQPTQQAPLHETFVKNEVALNQELQQDENNTVVTENQPEDEVAIESNPNAESVSEQQNGIPDFTLTTMPGASVSALDYSHITTLDLKVPVEVERKLPGRWELGFSVGTLAGFQATQQKLAIDGGQQSLMDNPTLDSEGGLFTNNWTPPAVNNGSSIVESSIKRPLSAEFTVARNLGKRWAVGSGIGLNYFRASNKYITPVQAEMNASFLSLSVPLTVDFDYIKHRRFEASVGTGLINEFPFYMRSEKTFVVPAAAKQDDKGFNRGYMASVLFRTSFSYRLNEAWSLNLSPNVRYYFHQSLQSEIPVLKRDSWAGVSLGVTWSL